MNPGESEQDFEQLKEFVEELRFDRLGVFTYSREEDTPAAAMEEQVPEEVAEKRRNEIMQIQQKIAFEKTSAQIGRALEVMVEGALPEDGVYITRTYMDAPEVDGYVFVATDWNLMSGDLFNREPCTDPVFHNGKPGMGTNGNRVSAFPFCPGLSGVFDPDLCCHLCSAGPVYPIVRRRARRDLGNGGLYGTAGFCPV